MSRSSCTLTSKPLTWLVYAVLYLTVLLNHTLPPILIAHCSCSTGESAHKRALPPRSSRLDPSSVPQLLGRDPRLYPQPRGAQEQSSWPPYRRDDRPGPAGSRFDKTSMGRPLGVSPQQGSGTTHHVTSERMSRSRSRGVALHSPCNVGEVVSSHLQRSCRRQLIRMARVR